jgi:hypothetical protein
VTKSRPRRASPGTNDGGDLAIPAASSYPEFETLVHGVTTQRWDASNVRETLQRLGTPSPCRPTSRFPSLSRPWTRVAVHEAPHMTSPTEGSATATWQVGRALQISRSSSDRLGRSVRLSTASTPGGTASPAGRHRAMTSRHEEKTSRGSRDHCGEGAGDA